jgi:hypothetical protein
LVRRAHFRLLVRPLSEATMPFRVGVFAMAYIFSCRVEEVVPKNSAGAVNLTAPDLNLP